jgi:3-phenylpropionate/trans-cinnamate dioxygenase ferredoxin reductase component
VERIVVAGGSIAGFSAAAELRAQGFDGQLRIVAAEPVRTYERPPLSKGVLAGDDPATTAWAAAADDGLDIDWVLGERAAALDVTARRVTLASGSELAYDGLVIATGARPRTLAGPGAPRRRARAAHPGRRHGPAGRPRRRCRPGSW